MSLKLQLSIKNDLTAQQFENLTAFLRFVQRFSVDGKPDIGSATSDTSAVCGLGLTLDQMKDAAALVLLLIWCLAHEHCGRTDAC